MRIGELLALYAVAGVFSAVLVHRASTARGARAWLSAALAIPFWPLWAPFFLARRVESRPAPGQVSSAAIARIEAALEETLAATEGSPLSALLSLEAADRIRVQIARAATRHAELDALLQRDGFDPAAARERVAHLEATGASPRALATARMQLANVEKLVALRDRDARGLSELEDAVATLRTQIVLARYAGSSLEGVGAIVADVWARVDGLGAAIEDAEERDAG